jgi:hypothetical protein
MAPKDLTEDEDLEFSRKLEFFLRSTGRLFPVTPAQVEAFEEYMAKHPHQPTPAPKNRLTAEEILQRGYVEYIPKAAPVPEEDVYDNDFRAAARNKGELTEDIMKMMREDQDKEKGKKK